MKKLNNDVLQFDNIDEFFNYSLKTYVDLFENEFDVNIIKSFCNMYDEIKTTHENILHIINFDDCFIVYENDNCTYLYTYDENDLIYVENEKFNNYDEFLNEYKLHYIE